jgi:hypothetical protein
MQSCVRICSWRIVRPFWVLCKQDRRNARCLRFGTIASCSQLRAPRWKYPRIAAFWNVTLYSLVALYADVFSDEVKHVLKVSQTDQVGAQAVFERCSVRIFSESLTILNAIYVISLSCSKEMPG